MQEVVAGCNSCATGFPFIDKLDIGLCDLTFQDRCSFPWLGPGYCN
jgi:hypothetical protein